MVLVCLLFLQLIYKKIVHHPLNMPIKSSHTLQESKFKKVFNLTVGTPELTICFLPKNTKKGKEKKKVKNPIPSNFYARNRCQKIREYSHSENRSFMQITLD